MENVLYVEDRTTWKEENQVNAFDLWYCRSGVTCYTQMCLSCRRHRVFNFRQGRPIQVETSEARFSLCLARRLCWFLSCFAFCNVRVVCLDVFRPQCFLKSTTLASSSILPKFPGSLKEVRDLRPAPISPLPLLSLSYHTYVVYSSVVRRTPPHISIRPMRLEVALNHPYLLAPYELRISNWRAKMTRYIAAISVKLFVLFSRKVLFGHYFSTTCFPLQQANTKKLPSSTLGSNQQKDHTSQ